MWDCGIGTVLPGPLSCTAWAIVLYCLGHCPVLPGPLSCTAWAIVHILQDDVMAIQWLMVAVPSLYQRPLPG
jgi:hypothetical protein